MQRTTALLAAQEHTMNRTELFEIKTRSTRTGKWTHRTLYAIRDLAAARADFLSRPAGSQMRRVFANN